MAIVTKDGERLYLRAWEYNAARIMTALAVIVNNNGGNVKPGHTAIISNRAVSSALIEIEDKISRIKDASSRSDDSEKNEKREAAIANYTQQLDKFKAIDNAPIEVTHTSYITFVLDETYYYYQVDDNPFFDFYWLKTPVKNGKYSKDAAMEADKKDWLLDCYFDSTCVQDEVKEAANLIFNMLCNAPASTIMRDSKKQRVPNTYNDGYHTEKVYAPERIGKIDF